MFQVRRATDPAPVPLQKPWPIEINNLQAVRIGNSNALFLAHGTPNTAPDALESVLGVGCDLLSVDSAAEMRLSWGSTAGES